MSDPKSDGGGKKAKATPESIRAEAAAEGRELTRAEKGRIAQLEKQAAARAARAAQQADPKVLAERKAKQEEAARRKAEARAKAAAAGGGGAGAQPKQQQQQKKQAKKSTKKGAGAASAGPSTRAAELAELPAFVAHRQALMDKLKEDPKSFANRFGTLPNAGEAITVTLPDGKEVAGKAGETTPFAVAAGISQGLANACLVAKLDRSKLWDMHRPLEASCQLELLKFDSPEGKFVFWHSSAHVLGEALERLYGAHLTRGPPQEEGFFYDVGMDGVLSSEDLPRITKVCQQITKERQEFERLAISKTEALEMFNYNPYKVHYINGLVKGNADEEAEGEGPSAAELEAQRAASEKEGPQNPDDMACTVYRCGTLVDFCPGPHIPHTAKINGFEAYQNSACYWLGKADNPQLQRIYGISFPDPKSLKLWQKRRAEAAQRDHRVIGTQQELFFFHEMSPGSAFMLPHGARIYNTLIDFIKSEYQKRGFTEVMSPNIYNSKLWETSGHWQHYSENMFHVPVDDQTFALKPMNCPGHCLLFDHRKRSYKELPMRLADFGVLHRNELAGALGGLTRVRRFQQDDGHIFCRPDQVGAEVEGALGFMKDVYGAFGFTFALELSTRPEKYLGEIEQWDQAEALLEKALNTFCAGVNDDRRAAAAAAAAAAGKEEGAAAAAAAGGAAGKKEDKEDDFGWRLNPGDGAFYGPKIDIQLTDALGRSHQCATIQVDFQLPIRFGLGYRTPAEEEERPVIIHRAILGSVERMMAVLMEHTAGKWPLWLSPRQVIVCTVSEKHDEYGEQVRQRIHDAGFFADINITPNTLPKKVREGQLAQYNFILVVGDKEVAGSTVNVRTRDNKVHGERSVDAFIEELKQLVAEKK